jgi:hypothetical protein
MNIRNKYQKLLPGVPLVESPFFDNFASEIWSGEELRIATDLNKNGYADNRIIGCARFF